ncbi:cell division protein [uncultured Winogradskyella sp.]|uniref:cell division protein n=1 Tax=uncultured Winogradskyella sp. TaxID=395353 RepID=UPI00260663DA|nr:cell division protein [uncultured Winogradskyella sp.]
MSVTPKIHSRNIPLPIQREVRQRCGFGCVICGIPLYEYEHMNEWAIVKRHVADEITLLCDKHHREKTSGLLPKQVVEKANLDPYNLRSGVSKPYDLYFSGNKINAVIGSNLFTYLCPKNSLSVMTPISIDGVPIVSVILMDNHLLLNIIIFDKFNNVVFEIRDNQLFYSTEPWDIQLVGTTLTIRESLGNILIEFKFTPPNLIEITRGKLLLNGVEVKIKPKEILINNNTISYIGNLIFDCTHFLALGPHHPNIKAMYNFNNIDRYK